MIVDDAHIPGYKRPNLAKCFFLPKLSSLHESIATPLNVIANPISGFSLQKNPGPTSPIFSYCIVRAIFTNPIVNVYILFHIMCLFGSRFLVSKSRNKNPFIINQTASRGRAARTRLSELSRQSAQHRRGAIKTLTVSTVLGYNELLSHIIANEMSE